MRSGVTSHEHPILQIVNAKGKYNKPLSKYYKLNLPPEKSKIEKISSKPSIPEKDTPVFACETLQCPRGGHCNVLQEDTNSNI